MLLHRLLYMYILQVVQPCSVNGIEVIVISFQQQVVLPTSIHAVMAAAYLYHSTVTLSLTVRTNQMNVIVVRFGFIFWFSRVYNSSLHSSATVVLSKGYKSRHL